MRPQTRSPRTLPPFVSNFAEKKLTPIFFLEIESMIAKTNFTLGPIEKSISFVQKHEYNALWISFEWSIFGFKISIQVFNCLGEVRVQTEKTFCDLGHNNHKQKLLILLMVTLYFQTIRTSSQIEYISKVLGLLINCQQQRVVQGVFFNSPPPKIYKYKKN